MTHSAGAVVSVVTHGVSAAYPAHEATHLTIDQRSQDQMIVIGHQLVAIEFYLMNFQTLMEDPLEGGVVRVLLETVRPKVATIQNVIQPTCFVSSW